MSIGLIVALVPGVAVGGEKASPDPDPQSVTVTWDFGAGPGRTGVRWVGSESISMTYEPPECREVFSLEALKHECPRMADSGERVCPAFLSATFRKHAEGEAELPRLEVVRNEYNKQRERTGATHTDLVPYVRAMATRVDDWNAAGIEIHIGLPAPELHNPTAWAEVRVLCN